VDHVLGMLANLSGQPETAAGHFDTAIELCREAGFRPALALTYSDFAEMLIDRDDPGDRVRATALRDEGIGIAIELGMKPLVGRLIAVSEHLGTTASKGEAGYSDGPAPDVSDGMTNLGNLRLFMTSLEVEQVLASGLGASSAAVKITLDGFRHVNSSHGYRVGNQLLYEIGETLRSDLPVSAMPCRTGPDEYCFVLRGIDPDTALTSAGSLLRSVLDTSVTAGDERVHVSGTAGIVMLPTEDADADRIPVFLDEAVDVARRSGRNSTHLFDPGEDAGSSSASLQQTTSLILDALAEDQFRLLRQPIVSVTDRTVGHYEVLLRMVNEDGSLRSPSEFIPQAESLNLVQQIDRWVVEHAMQVWKSHNDRGDFFQLAINVSGMSAGRDIAGYLREQADSNGVPHEAITVEITETAAMQDDRLAAEMAGSLHEAGFKLAIDDFGSGATSLAQVRELEFDYLKLDGTLVRDLAESAGDREFVSALAKLAHRTGVEIIAEFVQDEATMEFLAECGIEYAQGYFIGEPEPFPG
ncbi:MAG: phosphodiesterase, partial [Dehalococcoidia bacterium]|nr:phosphodiesterase [Dehalococcoidia bacterium]